MMGAVAAAFEVPPDEDELPAVGVSVAVYAASLALPPNLSPNPNPNPSPSPSPIPIPNPNPNPIPIPIPIPSRTRTLILTLLLPLTRSTATYGASSTNNTTFPTASLAPRSPSAWSASTSKIAQRVEREYQASTYTSYYAACTRYFGYARLKSLLAGATQHLKIQATVACNPPLQPDGPPLQPYVPGLRDAVPPAQAAEAAVWAGPLPHRRHAAAVRLQPYDPDPATLPFRSCNRIIQQGLAKEQIFPHLILRSLLPILTIGLAAVLCTWRLSRRWWRQATFSSLIYTTN
eukprot:scaffold22755_cov59-Phaeocystis_antarctica.AAC.3